MLFGAAYYPEHRDPSRWAHDLDAMAAASVNAVRVGEFAWKRFEPARGTYDFAWMDRFAELASARGIGLLMCPPLRTAPAWLVEADPTVQIVDERGIRLSYGSRYTFCINHPWLLECGMELARRMASHWAGCDAIVGWHLDNEYGDEPDCHCPLCRQKFQQWLAERYGDSDRLNRTWGTVFWGLEFDHFGQVPTPAVSKTVHNPGLLLAWRRFRSECTVEVVRLHADAVRSQTGNGKPVTTNFQVWNRRTDYFDEAGPLDVISCNYYPAYGQVHHGPGARLDAMRGYKRKGFWVVELRNGPHAMPGSAGNTPQPGQLEHLTAHTLAHGCDGVFYFRWRACPFGAEQNHGTLTDYDGRPKRAYAEAQRVGGILARVGERIERARVHSPLAVFHDFPTWWTMSTGSIWEGPAGLYMDRFGTTMRALHRCRVNVDVVGRKSPWGQYAGLFVPTLQAVDDDLADRLSEYVREGGTLVMHPWCGTRDPDVATFADRLHPELADLLGVDIREFVTAGPEEPIAFSYNGQRFGGSLFADLPALPQGTDTMGEFADAWFAGTPAVTSRPVGSGRAIYVASFPCEAFLTQLADDILNRAGVGPIVSTELPEHVEVASRREPDGNELIFLLNGSPDATDLDLPGTWQDLWNDEPLTGEVTLSPWGVRLLTGR